MIVKKIIQIIFKNTYILKTKSFPQTYTTHASTSNCHMSQLQESCNVCAPDFQCQEINVLELVAEQRKLYGHRYIFKSLSEEGPYGCILYQFHTFERQTTKRIID